MEQLAIVIFFMVILIVIVGGFYFLDCHLGVFDRFDPKGSSRIYDWKDEDLWTANEEAAGR